MQTLSQHSLIHPEDISDMSYWAKKWGVSARQIIDAILETGSLDPVRIKETLREKNQLNNQFYKLIKLFKKLIPAKRHAVPTLRRIA